MNRCYINTTPTPLKALVRTVLKRFEWMLNVCRCFFDEDVTIINRNDRVSCNVF